VSRGRPTRSSANGDTFSRGPGGKRARPRSCGSRPRLSGPPRVTRRARENSVTGGPLGRASSSRARSVGWVRPSRSVPPGPVSSWRTAGKHPGFHRGEAPRRLQRDHDLPATRSPPGRGPGRQPLGQHRRPSSPRRPHGETTGHQNPQQETRRGSKPHGGGVEVHAASQVAVHRTPLSQGSAPSQGWTAPPVGAFPGGCTPQPWSRSATPMGRSSSPRPDLLRTRRPR